MTNNPREQAIEVLAKALNEKMAFHEFKIHSTQTEFYNNQQKALAFLSKELATIALEAFNIEVVSKIYSKEKAQYLDILNFASTQDNLDRFRFCILTSYHTRNYNELDCDTPAPIKYDIRHLLHWCIGQINTKPQVYVENIGVKL